MEVLKMCRANIVKALLG